MRHLAAIGALLAACGGGRATPVEPEASAAVPDAAAAPLADAGVADAAVPAGFLRTTSFYAGGGWTPEPSWTATAALEPSVHRCWREQLAREPALHAAVILVVKGDQQGAVIDLEVTGAGDLDLHACLRGVLSTIQPGEPDPGGAPLVVWELAMYPTAEAAPELPELGTNEALERGVGGLCLGVTRYPCKAGKSCRAASQRRVRCPE
jgi:hypothetical protein